MIGSDYDYNRAQLVATLMAPMLAALHNGNVHESADSCRYDLPLDQFDNIPENLIQYCCEIADTILDECKNISSDDLMESEKNNCSDLKDAFIKPFDSEWQPLDKYPKDTCPVVDFRIMDYVGYIYDTGYYIPRKNAWRIGDEEWSDTWMPRVGTSWRWCGC
jgi:hypothetical protein